jgi:hypothetical protein
MSAWKGLLRSRKFWAAIIDILVVTAVQLGMPAEKANAISIAVTTVVSLYIVGTAAEDMASKFMLALVLLLPLGGIGCSLVRPGPTVRQGLEARAETVWDKDSNFRATESTTHARRSVIAEGEDVAIEYYQDGAPKRVEGAQALLSQVSDPKDAADSLNELNKLNLQFGMEMLATVRSVIPMIQMGGGARPPGTLPSPADMETQAKGWWDLLTPEQRAAYDEAWRKYVTPFLPPQQAPVAKPQIKRQRAKATGTRPAERVAKKRRAARRLAMRDL